VPWIKTGDLMDGYLTKYDEYISEDGVANSSAKLLPPHTVLLAMYGATVGRLGILSEPATCNQAACAMVVDPAVAEPRWLFYVLLNDRIRIVSEANGAAQQNLSARAIKNFLYRTPSLYEQRAIARVLGALDDKIAANIETAGTIDDYVAALFLEALTSAPVEDVALGELAEINAEVRRPVSGGSLRYIDISSVSVGRFDFPALSSWDNAPSRARRGVRKGDTVWSTVRPNRRSHALNLSDDELLVASTGLSVLSPRTVGFAYLYEATRLPSFTTYLESSAEGSAYPAVRPDRFAEAPVPLLKPSGVEAFEAVAAPLREYVFSLDQENQSLVATRDEMLPHLMSGKLRVKEAEKTVKEAL
jgi:type I restriction enzyme S subunit